MSKVKCLLADSDEEYVKHFNVYIRQSEYKHQLHIHSFTQLELLNKHIQENADERCLLLVTAQWLAQLEPSENMQIFVLGSTHEQQELPAHTLIHKYQSIQSIVRQLLLVKLEDKAVSFQHHSTELYTFFSSSSGTGKTTVALNLARIIGKERKVLYINLEKLSCVDLFLQPTENNEFALLVYYLQIKPKDWEHKLSSLIHHSDQLNCDYIMPAERSIDLQELSPEDVEAFITVVLKQQVYDYIILDLSSEIQSLQLKVLKLSHRILWLLTDDIFSLHRTKRIWKEIEQQHSEERTELESKVHYIMNRYTGSTLNDYMQEGIQIDGYLPYIPEWKSISSTTQLLNTQIYIGSLIKLFNILAPTDEVEAYGA